MQINDGPTSAGTVRNLYGATPATVNTGLLILDPIIFTNGLQVVTTGTGEIDIDWI